MNEKNKYLVKNIGLFLISAGVPQILLFLMTPLYTNCLTEAEYGVADLLTITVQILMPFFTLQIQDAVLRLAMDKDYSSKDVLSTSMQIILKGALFLSIILVIIYFIPAWDISPIYLGFILLSFLTGACTNIFSYFCRGIDKVKYVTIGSAISAFSSILCNIIFLLYFKWGLFGYLAANAIGAAANCIYVFVGAKLYRYIYIKRRSQSVKHDMIVMSIPMIFSALSWWINNSADKYILSWIKGMELVGIIAVAYKVPSLLLAFSNVIAKAFSISAIKEFDYNDQDGFLGSTYSTISMLVTIGCSCIIILNIPISGLLFSKGFFVAWKYVPPLLIAILFNQLSLLCENIFLAIKRTSFTCYTSIIGAATNIVLNFCLIPKFGAYGAVIATLLGFFIVWCLRFILVQKLIKIKNQTQKEFTAYILLFAQMIFAYFGNDFIVFQIIILLIIFVIYRKEILKMLLSFNSIRTK